jgi:hypothetical protein
VFTNPDLEEVAMADEACAILKVSSIPTTLEFYRSLGFEVHGMFPDDEPTWAEVGRDGLVLQFLSGETPWPREPGFTGCFYVHPHSVLAVYEDVKDSVGGRVEEREWGAIELTLQDPDGYFVTFTEPTPPPLP